MLWNALNALKWTVLPCHFTKCLSKYLSVPHYAAQFASVSKGLPTTLLWLQIYDARHALWPRDLHNQGHRVLLSFVICFTLLEIPIISFFGKLRIFKSCSITISTADIPTRWPVNLDEQYSSCSTSLWSLDEQYRSYSSLHCECDWIWNHLGVSVRVFSERFTQIRKTYSKCW